MKLTKNIKEIYNEPRNSFKLEILSIERDLNVDFNIVIEKFTN